MPLNFLKGLFYVKQAISIHSANEVAKNPKKKNPIKILKYYEKN